MTDIERQTVVSLSVYAGFETFEQATAALARHGVTYSSYIAPTGVTENWRFYGCQNVPEPIPTNWAVWRENVEWSDIGGWGVELLPNQNEGQ